MAGIPTWCRRWFIIRRTPALLALLALTAGCPNGTGTTPTDAGEPLDAGPPPKVRLSWRTSLPLLTGIAPEPAAYAEAKTTWRTATTALSRGDLDASAEGFLRVADQLRIGDENPYARTFAAGRCMAYENAAAVWAALERFEVAVDRLGPRATQDPSCRASIQDALERTKRTNSGTGPELPVPSDFAAEAERSIDTSNYPAELDTVENEIER